MHWKHSACVGVVAFAALVPAEILRAQVTAEFHRTLTVTSAEAVMLEVEVPCGDLEVAYRRDGEISIATVAKSASGAKLDSKDFASTLTVEQDGNQIRIKQASQRELCEPGISIFYRVDVPYRTELTSTLDRGKQSIRGILGPVKVVTGTGDVTVAYVSKAVEVQAGSGDLDVQVVGEHVEAKTGRGNIAGSRLPKGVSAETGDGDITLMVVGPSTATVKKGSGRIDVGGARGSFAGSTDAGELHVKAIPHEDWILKSGTGNIRLELPPDGKFELEASTRTGALELGREDIVKPEGDALQLHQSVNGGGKRIEARTESGRIAIR